MPCDFASCAAFVKVNGMKMHMLSGGRLRLRAATYFADVPKDATVDLPCVCVLLRHPGGNVLFDTGCHPQVATDAQARWGELARVVVPLHAPGDDVLGSLTAIGLGPDDIDVVVNSHLHMDHCGCNAFFPKASFVMHAQELTAARDPARQGRGYVQGEWDHPMRCEPIDGDKDLFDDNRIVLTPLPGHTPGSIGALVELGTGPWLLASDALSLRATLTSDFMPRNNWDNEVYRGSLDKIRALQALGAQVLCGHDAAQWDSLRKGADAYE